MMGEKKMKGIGQIIEGLEHCEGDGCRREGCPYAEDGVTCFYALQYDARLTLEMVRDFIAEAMRSRIMDRLTDKLDGELAAVRRIREEMDAVRASDAEYYEDEDDSY